MIPVLQMRGFRGRFFVAMVLLLSVAGCGAPRQEAKTDVPEYRQGQPADADGDGEISPLEAHMMARRMVNPQGDSEKYTYQAGQPHEDYHTRLRAMAGDVAPARPLQDRRRVASAPPLPGQKPGFRPAPDIDGRPFQPDADIDPAPLPGHKPARHAAAPEDEVYPENEIAPVPVPPPTPARTGSAEKPAAAPRAGSAVVTGLRLGEHTGRTRLVLDLSGPSGYSVKVDNAAHVLRIELPAAGWGAEDARDFRGHALFERYAARALGPGGTVLEVRLRRDAKLVTSVALPPNEVYGHRVYFDIGPA